MAEAQMAQMAAQIAELANVVQQLRVDQQAAQAAQAGAAGAQGAAGAAGGSLARTYGGGRGEQGSGRAASSGRSIRARAHAATACYVAKNIG